jgi:hypothetical protein
MEPVGYLLLSLTYFWGGVRAQRNRDKNGAHCFMCAACCYLAMAIVKVAT